MSIINTRNAVLADAERLLEIYSFYVQRTAISFEYDVPTTDEFRERIRKTTEKYPYLVIEKSEDEYLTTNSADFHAHLGFTEVGHFHQCGYKFGRWYDMIWMEKIICS